MYYLRKLNVEYDHKINFKNVILDRQNEELKKAFEKLKRAQDHLIQSEKMIALGTLTAGVAHEINNPLNFISGGHSILQESIEDYLNKNEQIDFNLVMENLNVIETGLNRAEKILNSLMIFSHQGKSEHTRANIQNLIDDVLVYMKGKIDDNIEIFKDYNFDQDVPLYMDKIHQVFANIIDNAVDAVKLVEENEEKYLLIKTSLEDKVNEVSIEFFNSGPNIPEEYLKHIFDPFFTTKEVGHGTGLGLSISYNLVKEHGGIIECKNKPNGVSFFVRLPLDIKENSE